MLPDAEHDPDDEDCTCDDCLDAAIAAEQDAEQDGDSFGVAPFGTTAFGSAESEALDTEVVRRQAYTVKVHRRPYSKRADIHPFRRALEREKWRRYWEANREVILVRKRAKKAEDRAYERALKAAGDPGALARAEAHAKQQRSYYAANAEAEREKARRRRARKRRYTEADAVLTELESLLAE